ncbi:MAG: metallophosphoesterase [Candidatus Thermoplasmatota archaeon]|nr:metallophosphoesterase [Candidatus Thermoplasmatota archaeon]
MDRPWLAKRKAFDPRPMMERMSDPDEVRGFLASAIQLYKDRNEFPFIEIGPTERPVELIIAGDIHGDLLTAGKVVSHFLKRFDGEKGRTDVKLLFLGDIIDRPPDDDPYGGLLTLLYLLSLKTAYPDSVFLLRGNHECYDLEPFFPHELPVEIREMYGEENEDRIMTMVRELFTHLPIMVKTKNGLFASHAGFPWLFKGDLRDIKRENHDAILQTTWGDPFETGYYRGMISDFSNYDEKEFSKFMEKAECTVFVRGHQSQLNGYSIYGGRMATIFTSRRYERSGAGGILIAELGVPPVDRTITIDEIKVKKLSDAGFIVYNLVDGSMLPFFREIGRSKDEEE